MCPCIPDRIEIWQSWFLRRWENWSTRRKNLLEQGENQQPTQPIYMMPGPGIEPGPHLVGGECHCTTSAPQ